MPPIAEGEKVFPNLPEKVHDLSLRACLGRLLSGDDPSYIYRELGVKGYANLAKPLQELVEKDREYALYVHSSIDGSGRVNRQEIKTYEEWKMLKEKRQGRIETLTARTIFQESSESPQAGTGDKLAYGE